MLPLSYLSPVSSDPAILDSPIIDILPLPEQVPTSYSANQQGFAECEILSPNPSEGDSAVCLDKREGPDSRTVSKDKQTLFPDNPSIPEDPTLPYVLPDSRLEHCEHLGCMKSTIPLSKLKGLQDELDIPEVVEFKCSDCVGSGLEPVGSGLEPVGSGLEPVSSGIGTGRSRQMSDPEGFDQVA